jgi:hypothetical protein
MKSDQLEKERRAYGSGIQLPGPFFLSLPRNLFENDAVWKIIHPQSVKTVPTTSYEKPRCRSASQEACPGTARIFIAI